MKQIPDTSPSWVMLEPTRNQQALTLLEFEELIWNVWIRDKVLSLLDLRWSLEEFSARIMDIYREVWKSGLSEREICVLASECGFGMIDREILRDWMQYLLVTKAAWEHLPFTTSLEDWLVWSTFRQKKKNTLKLKNERRERKMLAKKNQKNQQIPQKKERVWTKMKWSFY